MRAVDVIQRKRDGKELTGEEIRFLIQGYSEGQVPDYQMAAWAMAVYYQGMTARETAELTLAMAQSGDQVDLSAIRGIKVDKHSTGGVGDKTTLVLGPLVAAAGVPVAKMSGRGLGHTGGTIDKLEAIEGFQVELDQSAFIRQVNDCGIAVISQSGNITPADKKLYALRDVTATVDTLPLIASSVMSKKIAAGADGIVLDVKAGSGAFMKTVEDAVELAKAMAGIGHEVGRDVVAVISGMDQPLGYAIGNALEVKEAIDTLRNQGPSDLRELCLVLGAQMLIVGGKAANDEEARHLLEGILASGAAFTKFKELVKAQGGRTDVLDQPELLPAAVEQTAATSPSQGIVNGINAEQIGIAAMLLGAGRETKDSVIDPGAGVVLLKKVGDTVSADEPLAMLHVGKGYEDRVTEAIAKIRSAYRIDQTPAKPDPLIYGIVDQNGYRPWQV